MTRVLVVHHDISIADHEVASLQALGYEVDRCSGPDRRACPVLAGQPCLRAERADVLIYDLRSLLHERNDLDLVDQLRGLYADKPIVVVGGDPVDDPAAEVEMGVGIVRLRGPVTAERLDEVLEDALADR